MVLGYEVLINVEDLLGRNEVYFLPPVDTHIVSLPVSSKNSNGWPGVPKLNVMK